MTDSDKRLEGGATREERGLASELREHYKSNGSDMNSNLRRVLNAVLHSHKDTPLKQETGIDVLPFLKAVSANPLKFDFASYDNDSLPPENIRQVRQYLGDKKSRLQQVYESVANGQQPAAPSPPPPETPSPPMGTSPMSHGESSLSASAPEFKPDTGSGKPHRLMDRGSMWKAGMNRRC